MSDASSDADAGDDAVSDVDKRFAERIADDEYADRIHILTGDNHYAGDGERIRTGDLLVPTRSNLERSRKKFEPLSFDAIECPLCERARGRYPRPFLERVAEEDPERLRAVAAVSHHAVAEPFDAALEEIIATLAGENR